jgi:hypothetical protein
MTLEDLAKNGKMILSTDDLPVTIPEFDDFLRTNPIYVKQDGYYMRVVEREDQKPTDEGADATFFKDRINKMLSASMDNPNNKSLLNAIRVYNGVYKQGVMTVSQAEELIATVIDNIMPVVVAKMKDNLEQEAYKISKIQQEISAELMGILEEKTKE